MQEIKTCQPCNTISTESTQARQTLLYKISSICSAQALFKSLLLILLAQHSHQLLSLPSGAAHCVLSFFVPRERRIYSPPECMSTFLHAKRATCNHTTPHSGRSRSPLPLLRTCTVRGNCFSHSLAGLYLASLVFDLAASCCAHALTRCISFPSAIYIHRCTWSKLSRRQVLLLHDAKMAKVHKSLKCNSRSGATHANASRLCI